MTTTRLLIVEDNLDISNLHKMIFTNQGYEVDTAFNGAQALEKTRHSIPDLIVLDVMLPDIDGYEICKRLRESSRTSHIPIIFVTQKDERGDRLQGLELGADDYIAKPFDNDELKLRVQGALRRAERESLTDPRSGLPSGQLIEEQLRRIIHTEGWAYIEIKVENFIPFREVYGFVAADDALRFTALQINETLDETGSTNDFVGNAGGENFVVITTQDRAQKVMERLRAKFDTEILTQYSFIDRGNGFILAPDSTGSVQKQAFMRLSIGCVTPQDGDFADIREITEVASAKRREDR